MWTSKRRHERAVPDGDDALVGSLDVLEIDHVPKSAIGRALGRHHLLWIEGNEASAIDLDANEPRDALGSNLEGCSPRMNEVREDGDRARITRVDVDFHRHGTRWMRR